MLVGLCHSLVFCSVLLILCLPLQRNTWEERSWLPFVVEPHMTVLHLCEVLYRSQRSSLPMSAVGTSLIKSANPSPASEPLDSKQTLQAAGVVAGSVLHYIPIIDCG